MSKKKRKNKAFGEIRPNAKGFGKFHHNSSKKAAHKQSEIEIEVDSDYEYILLIPRHLLIDDSASDGGLE